jgi:hypothetical protein
MSEWYYRIGERIYGPYSEEDLRERIRSRKIPSNVSVSRNGFSDWEKAPASLLEDDKRAGKAQGGATSRQKFAWPFRRRRPPVSRTPQTDARSRFRRRLQVWSVGVILAGIIAFAVVKSIDFAAVSDWAQDLPGLFRSSGESRYTLDQTRRCWGKIRAGKQSAMEALGKMPQGEYPFTVDNQPDMMRFTDKEFETFKLFQLNRAKTAGNFVAKLEKLHTYGVDPALLHYKFELREVWMMLAGGCAEFGEIANDIQERRACFASPEAYALRFGTNAAGASDMEYGKRISEDHIIEKIKELTALMVKGDQSLATLNTREEEVKALLTARYASKFE